MKRAILLAMALLFLSGCGVGKRIKSMTVDLVLPSKSDKILKSGLVEQVAVTEVDMFGTTAVRQKEVVHNKPLKKLVADIYLKPEVVEMPEDGKGNGQSGASASGAAGKPPKYELTAEVNLDRYANVADIRKIFRKCTVKAALQYDEKRGVVEFTGGEKAFEGTCEQIKDPYDDVQQFIARNKKFGYGIRQDFPTPFHILRKEPPPNLFALYFTDSKELSADVTAFEKSAKELEKIFPKTRISEKGDPALTPEILLGWLNQVSKLKEEEQQIKKETPMTMPNEDDVDRYVKGIVLEGGLFTNTDDPPQTERRLSFYHSIFPRKNIILLAKFYLFIANDLIDDAENIILENAQRKVDDFFHGSTVEELFESAWPDYYRTALEKTRGWLAANTHYDAAELEKQFFAQAAKDEELSKKEQLLDKPTFMAQHYPDVVIYLLTNNVIKPQNAVEKKFLNTFNYYSGYDDFAELHDFLLFNIH